VARLDALLAASPDKRLTVTHACAMLATAERTLRAACADVVGMSPQRYMQLYRLRLARERLLAPPSRTVTEAATAHGFYELGRFAAAYRAEFGEQPSATLRRASALPPAPARL
jgi:AraC-like DNA-binding protein